ncbi:hypothetical protein TI05_16645 [Achromatium sp. WMS3]|nr:hypothetical protein TI05_16645 [Achromatium sp. WMS3]
MPILDKSNQTEETVVIVEDGETNQARERQLDARSYIEPSSKPRLDHNGNMILIIQTGPATTSDNASTARSKAASYIASSKKGKCTAAVESDVGIIDGIASDDSRTSTNSSNRGSVALTNCR